jgi:hypothetical protein
MLLVQGRGEMAVLPAVTAVLLHHSTIGIWTDCNVVSTGYRVNGSSACSYCSTVTSQYIPQCRPLLSLSFSINK